MGTTKLVDCRWIEWRGDRNSFLVDDRGNRIAPGGVACVAVTRDLPPARYWRPSQPPEGEESPPAQLEMRVVNDRSEMSWGTVFEAPDAS